MRTRVLPIHFPEGSPDGPWGVNSIGDDWYVIHKGGQRHAKRIGPAKPKGVNYFDRALAEAHGRNREGLA